MIETALVDLIDNATSECAEQERPDLHTRLRQIRNRVLDPAQLVLVVGEAKQGKSELINSIVNAPVCLAGEDVTTVVPTIVRYSEEPQAQLIEQASATGPAPGPPALERVPVAIEKVGAEIERAVANGRPLARGEVGVPRQILENGLVLMDTPGVGSMSATLTATTQAVIAEADALLMVSDASQELTTNEISFLRTVTKLCPNVALVQPKIDLSAHWRTVIQVNRKHLNNAGLGCKIFPVSSLIRAKATSTRDGALNDESGFPTLLDFLRTELASKQDQVSRNLVAHNVADALDQITDGLKSELANQNPRTATETLLELEQQQRRADDLRRVSTRWQKTLSDGITELYSDIEYDFRERAWAVMQEANDTFDEADPVTNWEDFASWLDASLATAIKENYSWLNERRERLLNKVLENLGELCTSNMLELPEAKPGKPMDRVPDPREPNNANYGKFDQFLTGLRGSYGGVLMFGLITSTAFGLGLMNVVSLSAGIFLGQRSLAEEKESRLKRRQAEAKGNAQRYVEHVIYQVNKETKDCIRHTHQLINSHFSAVMEHAQMQVSTAIQDIKRQAEQSAVDKDQRARTIKKKLEELALLRRRATMLTSNRITAA